MDDYNPIEFKLSNTEETPNQGRTLTEFLQEKLNDIVAQLDETEIEYYDITVKLLDKTKIRLVGSVHGIRTSKHNKNHHIANRTNQRKS